MANPVERLHLELETIARSNSPSMSITSVSPEGLPHSATVWFAPTDQLDLLTLSAPSRVHSSHIDKCIELGRSALVSGTIREEGLIKSQDVHGLSYEGIADHITQPGDIDKALGTFLDYGTFGEDELNKYLRHPTSEVPSHAIYIVRPTLWTVFDGRLGPNNPERLVHFNWPNLNTP